MPVFSSLREIDAFDRTDERIRQEGSKTYMKVLRADMLEDESTTAPSHWMRRFCTRELRRALLRSR